MASQWCLFRPTFLPDWAAYAEFSLGLCNSPLFVTASTNQWIPLHLFNSKNCSIKLEFKVTQRFQWMRFRPIPTIGIVRVHRGAKGHSLLALLVLDFNNEWL